MSALLSPSPARHLNSIENNELLITLLITITHIVLGARVQSQSLRTPHHNLLCFVPAKDETVLVTERGNQSKIVCFGYSGLFGAVSTLGVMIDFVTQQRT